MTQIRKTYKEVNPDLLYDEVRDFVVKQGVNVDQAKMESYAFPGDTSSFMTRGTLTFKCTGNEGKTCCLRAHVVGSARTETKVMLDIEDGLFPQDKIAALLDDLEFIFGPYEVRPRDKAR